MMHIQRVALLGAAATALALSGFHPAFAAEARQKLIDENEKVKVIDVVEAPGDTGAMITRLGNVLYVVAGGTFERTYADGTKEVTPRKTGDVVIVKEKRPYSVKNIGKTTIHLIEIEPK